MAGRRRLIDPDEPTPEGSSSPDSTPPAPPRRRRRTPRRRIAVRSLLMGSLCVLLVAGPLVASGLSQDERVPARAPRDAAAVALSPTSVAVRWSDAPATDYVVRLASDRAMTQDVVERRTSGSRAVVRGLEGTDGRLYYEIEARTGDERATTRAREVTLQPGALTRVKKAKVSTTGVRLTWRRPANTEAYDVVIARDKAFGKDVVARRTTSAKPVFATDDLEPRRTYWVKVRPVNGDLPGAFAAPVKVRTRADATALRVAAWNVCSESCPGYGRRGQLAAQFLRAQDLDVFTLQEAGGKRVGAVTQRLFSGGPQQFVRADGGGNTVYVFYRGDRFEQEAGGNVDLGDDRHLAWARLRHRDTGRRFVAVSIHVENGKSAGADAKRRREVQRAVGAMAQANPEGLPIVYAGDLNSGVHRSRDSPGVVLRGAGLVDARYVSTSPPVNAQYNSGHSWSPGDVPRSGDHVDHIFVSPDVTVAGWKQLVRLAGGRYATPMVSDHNAISADLVIGEKVAAIGATTETVASPDESLR